MRAFLRALLEVTTRAYVGHHAPSTSRAITRWVYRLPNVVRNGYVVVRNGCFRVNQFNTFDYDTCKRTPSYCSIDNPTLGSPWTPLVPYAWNVPARSLERNSPPENEFLHNFYVL